MTQKGTVKTGHCVKKTKPLLANNTGDEGNFIQCTSRTLSC